MKLPQIVHNQDLFIALLEKSKWIDPQVRKGNMFGCPAVFHGKRMAVCVYGELLGLKVPEHIATSCIDNGTAISFQPYGKRKMREWIAIRGGLDVLDTHIDLITTAIAYAENNN